MTTATDNMWIYLAGSGKVTIDWGDGTEETYTLQSLTEETSIYSSTYRHSHNYFDTS